MSIVSEALYPGKHVVLHVVPSWIYAGTVTAVDDSHVQLHDAIYQEGVAAGSSCWDAAIGKIGSTWPILDGVVILIGSITTIVPAMKGFRGASKKRQSEAVEKT